MNDINKITYGKQNKSIRYTADKFYQDQRASFIVKNDI